MSDPEIDKLASKIALQWQEHDEKRRESLAAARAAFEPISKHLKELNDGLQDLRDTVRREVKRSANIKLVKDWSIERGRPRCEYVVTMDGVAPSTLSFSAGRQRKGYAVEFKNDQYGTTDIVMLLKVLREEVGKALTPPKA